MNFATPEFNNILEQSVARFIRDRYSFQQHIACIESECGFSEDHWQTYAELGWLSLPISEEFGGLGGSAANIGVIMQQFGRAIAVSPYLASAIVASSILQQVAASELSRGLLTQLGAGEIIVSTALYERHSRYQLDQTTTVAEQDQGNWLLSGHKVNVPYGNVASHFIVVGRTSDQHAEKKALSLFLVSRDQSGLEIKNFTTHDGGRVSNLLFNRVEAQLLEHGTSVTTILANTTCLAIAAICAELSGAAWFVFEQTLEYLKTRSQFGKKLGEFQSLQHRMVDMYMQCQFAQSLADDTARAVDELEGVARDQLIAGARWQIGEIAVKVAEESIQLHGAIGMMDEIPIGHYLKRITTLNSSFGDTMHHQTRYRSLAQQKS